MTSQNLGILLSPIQNIGLQPFLINIFQSTCLIVSKLAEKLDSIKFYMFQVSFMCRNLENLVQKCQGLGIKQTATVDYALWTKGKILHTSSLDAVSVDYKSQGLTC